MVREHNLYDINPLKLVLWFKIWSILVTTLGAVFHLYLSCQTCWSCSSTFYIHMNVCVCLLSVSEKNVKISILIVDLSISPLSSVNFCFWHHVTECIEVLTILFFQSNNPFIIMNSILILTLLAKMSILPDNT